ncbi:membrane glycoprotein US10 [Panine betaherpesvirus 2]|uniref:Membrane glycoprotein US10 n=1 Tax=Panine betaherpesvirus 2 TaxID=188763 RepID=Q8QRU9_9BETA|nr:membrane glycoprotein US10 [Panine betaherpesvirus 2]AAM00789.2 membrane glycoprotein US10 [Panine betaherpesvirus 2]QXV67907.1 membrane glycoprotein US10 [Panine betaherpesvirus 2]
MGDWRMIRCVLGAWLLSLGATDRQEGSSSPRATNEVSHFTCSCVIKNHVLSGTLQMHGLFTPGTQKAVALLHLGDDDRRPVAVKGLATATEATYTLGPTPVVWTEGGDERHGPLSEQNCSVSLEMSPNPRGELFMCPATAYDSGTVMGLVMDLVHMWYQGDYWAMLRVYVGIFCGSYVITRSLLLLTGVDTGR